MSELYMQRNENLAPYSFDDLIAELHTVTNTLPDNRKGSNTHYRIRDGILSAFSVFFMQSPSFLAHQLKLQQVHGTSNAKTLFQIHHIPSDNQIRNSVPQALEEVVDGLTTKYESYREDGGGPTGVDYQE